MEGTPFNPSTVCLHRAIVIFSHRYVIVCIVYTEKPAQLITSVYWTPPYIGHFFIHRHLDRKSIGKGSPYTERLHTLNNFGGFPLSVQLMQVSLYCVFCFPYNIV